MFKPKLHPWFWKVLFSWNVSCFWKHGYRQQNYFWPFSVWFTRCFSLHCWSWDAEAVFLILVQGYFSTPLYITGKALVTAHPWPSLPPAVSKDAWLNIYIFANNSNHVNECVWSTEKCDQYNPAKVFVLQHHFFFLFIPSLTFHLFLFHCPLTGNGKISFFHSIAPSSRECACIDLITTGWH